MANHNKNSEHDSGGFSKFMSMTFVVLIYLLLFLKIVLLK